MKTLLLISILALAVTPIFAQTSTAAYDQLMNQAGSLIASGNLDAAKQTAQQALQLDGQNWRGNALMAAILQKQDDLTNAQIYIQKAIATAPADKKDKLNEMAQTIAASATQGAPAVSGEMSPEARIKYNALMLIAQDADKATLEDDRKKALREFMAKSAAFLELEPDATNVWVMRALTAAELDYPVDGFYAGRKLKELGLESSDDPKVQKALAELDLKDWLGQEIKWRDWSRWTTDQIRAAANDGDEEAQCALGDWYLNGEAGLTKDDVEAGSWYRKAAEQGNACAQVYLGQMYENGWGVDKDYAEAVKWYLKSAESADSQGQLKLGKMYENGWGVSRDYTEALRYYLKSAGQGDSDGQLELAHVFENGQGVPQDYVQALDWFQKSAAQGNANGQFSLGVLYQHGWGVTQDYAQALDWYQKSAAQGNADGRCNLGWMYEYGKGVTQDYAQALDWLQRSALHDNSSAENNLGDMYRNGWGVTKDYAQALRWYQKSAAQGNASGEDVLGEMYQNGSGVEKDIAQATNWYQKAADQGNVDAKAHLAALNSIQ